MHSESSVLAPPPRLETLHPLFEAQADARPGAVAIVHGDEEATYAELEDRSNRLAHYLRERGFGRGALVAVLLPRSIDHVVAMLGVLKSGACCVPLDPENPAARIDAVLGDCDPAALVTGGAPFRYGGTVIDLHSPEVAAASPERPERADAAAPQPHDLAFILYVSGNARPKGVMIEHHNAAHEVRSRGRTFGLRPDDRVYQGAAPGTGRSIEEMWLALEAGGTLIAATREMFLAGPHLPRLLTLLRVSVVSTSPGRLEALHGEAPTLRLVLLSGESCPGGLAARWARPGRRIVLTYGAAETTGAATFADLAPGGPMHFGRPLPGTRVRIAAPDLRPLEIGEVGEVCVGGAGLGRGYFGRAAESWARFVHDPWAPADLTDARVFRTGDYGRLDRDGNLHLVGRADSQARLRGERIDLGEIETELSSIEGVQGAACTVRQDGGHGPRLVACVVRRPGSLVDGEALRSRLRTRLPAAMVPAAVGIVERLPRLENGSLDRAALPDPRPRGVRPPSPGGAPHDVAEFRIAALWDGMFAPEHVSREDHFFFDLGGHSLLALRMVAELRKEPGFAHATVEDVYEHPTVASLAAALRRSPRRRSALSPSSSRVA